jgi:uncharacterized membrane protein
LLAKAIGKDRKRSLSTVFYAVAIVVAFANRWIAAAICVSIALVSLIPDRRIERAIG